MIRCRFLTALAAFTLFAQNQRFEVAAIRLNTDSGPMLILGAALHKGSLTAGKVTQRQMLKAAYHVSEAQIIGPGSLDEHRFDIAGRAPAGVPDSEFPAMFQTLLKERFHLETHFETREMPVYFLRIAKGGVKMTTGAAPDGGPEKFDNHPEMRGFPMMRGSLTTAQMAEVLADVVSRPVIDETGLTARYNYFLSFAPVTPQSGNAVPEFAPPDIFTALQKQAGLTLESGKDSVKVVVVDHMDRMPTDN